MIAKRLLAVTVALLVTVGVAAAPSAAEGDEYSVPSRGSIEFVPSSNPLLVSADAGNLIGVSWVAANSPVRLANGTMSSRDTLFLRLRSLTADNASITQTVNGRSVQLSNLNGSDPRTAARLGAEGTTVDVWLDVISLDVCISAQTLTTIVNGYATRFGTGLGDVLAMIANIFSPIANGPGGDAGPCVSMVELVPLLSAIVQAGVPLPDELPVVNIKLNAYAVNIAAPPGTTSISLPLTKLAVENA